jgi:8-oxo-dGTP pyrophosphatase MutT (NUDIX family)
MGASVLPVTIHNGQIYFLFGKERDIDENPGWSDFGGGTDSNESFMQTAVREAGEELTGFLGNSKTIKKMLTKYGTYNIDYKSKGYNTYRCHIFPINSKDHCAFECLPFYYNNNQQFLQKRLPNKIIRDTKIFEKVEIKWFSFNDMKTHHKEFRSFYQNIVHLILGNRSAIENFVFSSLVNKDNNKNKKLFTKKRRTNKKITRKTY